MQNRTVWFRERGYSARCLRHFAGGFLRATRQRQWKLLRRRHSPKEQKLLGKMPNRAGSMPALPFKRRTPDPLACFLLVIAISIARAEEPTPTPLPSEAEVESVVVSATRFDIPLD